MNGAVQVLRAGNYVRFILPASLLVTSLLSSMLLNSNAIAHAEHDKPRYVAENGTNEGYCERVTSPCKSIAYAASKANKGDRIKIAAGSYTITDSDDVFFLLSELITVEGQYSQKDNYHKRSPNNITRLVGVPLEYADTLSKRGFTVIVDTKGKSRDTSLKVRQKLSDYKQLLSAKPAENCVDGNAGLYACNHIDLLSHTPLSRFSTNPREANDIWGHYDLNNNREYAIIGLINGVGVVDVTDPENPNVVDSIASESTTWRDIKVYQSFNRAVNKWEAFAYVTADNARVGLMILDLRDLPNNVSVYGTDTTDLAAHNVYLSNVDYSTGVTITGAEPYLHIMGSNVAMGTFSSYSLDNPSAPQKIYAPLSRGRGYYAHDAASMIITDERKETQCFGGGSYCEVLFDFNEREVRLWDKTNNESPRELSSFSYNNASYIHSGWYTEDKQIVLVHDELDERAFNINTTVRLFELSDLRHPVLLSTWTGSKRAIDHNGFVRGNRYYMSNYTAGMTVLDLTDVNNPVEVGFFDTYPLSNNTTFFGAWGVYPYLPSGNILVSDINSGLYVLRDNTIDTDRGKAIFNQSEYSVDEGEAVIVTVLREEGITGAVDVSWELVAGSADENDFVLDSGIFSWADSDASNMQIRVQTNEDSEGEPNEIFFVRLYDPRSGLSLGQPNLAKISISDSGNQAPYITLEGRAVAAESNVTLVAVAVDHDGSISSYSWEQISGDSVSLSNASSATTSFVAPQMLGALVFRLSVTDNLGLTVSKDVTIQVENSIQPDGGESNGGGGSYNFAFFILLLLVFYSKLIKSEVIHRNKRRRT